VVCPKCGNPASGDEQTCQNCGAELDKSIEGLEVKSEGLRRMSQELKAVDTSRQRFADGETFADRFEIEELVETGPFGEVYRAHDEIVETEVAVKIFEEDVVRTPPEREEFLAATRAARAMTQEHVVRIHDSGVHDEDPWVSMQYLEGLTLRKALELREKKDERFSLEELEPIVTQITLALQHIGREFPDGNLKPTNIFFLPDLLKVTDGYILSAIPGDVFTERLEDSKYLAPELHTSTADADGRCDVYSLGMIIGEMIFGPNYTPGSDAVTEPEESSIDALCRRATAFDPAERYATVEALSEDFQTLVDTGQLLDRGPGPGGPAPAADSSPTSGEPGIDEFPEDEIATADYDRMHSDGSESGGMAPTNEMDRDEYPPPESGSDGELPPEPSAGETGAGAVPGDDQPTREHDAPEARETSRPGETRISRDDDDEQGALSAAIVGGFLFVLVVGAVGVARMTEDNSEQEVVDISEESDSRAQAAGSHIGARGAAADVDAGDAGADAERDTGPDPDVLAAAVGEGAGAIAQSLEAASEKAEQKGKELEDNDDEGGRASGGSSSGAGSSAGSAGGGGEPQGTDCPDGMALVEWDQGNFCIDRFEYPGRNRTPTVEATWFEAKSDCRNQGKRLCALREWQRACGVKYPYGREWDPDRCNTQDRDGFSRSLAASGEFNECRAWTGAYDMVGNAHEWVEEQKIVGGGFDSGPDVATCRYASAKSPGSGSPTVGFRCCADAE